MRVNEKYLLRPHSETQDKYICFEISKTDHKSRNSDYYRRWNRAGLHKEGRPDEREVESGRFPRARSFSGARKRNFNGKRDVE